MSDKDTVARALALGTRIMPEAPGSLAVRIQVRLLALAALLLSMACRPGIERVPDVSDPLPPPPTPKRHPRVLRIVLLDDGTPLLILRNGP